MPRYMYLYKGEATPADQMSDEQRNQVMGKWAAWMEKTGPALVDWGNPFGESTSVIDDGSTGRPSAMSGFSIVEAPDLAGAKTLAEGHPYLSEGKGDFAIDIVELVPPPSMG